MKEYSRFVVVVDNLSSSTPTKDIEYEFGYAGRIRDIARDYKARCALVEFERSADAKYAWQKMDGFRMDGRRWKVDWASYEDFKMFGWKWFEGRAPSPYRGRSRSRSRSPPVTPHDTDRKADKSNSPRREASRSRSRSPAPRDD